jgi:glucose-6-phosphate isomerase
MPQLVTDHVASRLFAKDPTLWGPDAESESALRLSWVSLGRTSRPLLGEVSALRDHLAQQGVDHVVLCGMGGSSLAPEVICASAGVDLTVLDSSNPDSVRTALADRLDRAVVVVSSKSGSTVETDSQRRVFKDAFTRAGIDPTQRIVIVTDPGSPLDKDSRAAGYRVINADPFVGGRFSALTAFGLVPSGLAGVDLEQLLDEAESVADLLADDDEANPALRLGAAMAGTQPLRDKLVLLDDGSPIPGFADWAEQLIAESTGKNGTGILPVIVGADPDNPDPEVLAPSARITVARLVADPADDDSTDDDTDEAAQAIQATVDPSRSEVQVSGSLGAAPVGGCHGGGRPDSGHQPFRPA